MKCSKCTYVNFIPFNFGSIYQCPAINIVLSDYESQRTDIEQSQEYMPSTLNNERYEELANQKNLENTKNFSLNWLKSAMPIGMLDARALTQSNTKSNCPIMYYGCPRCAYADPNASIGSTPDVVTLDYIYRIWFKLRDASSRLDTCLLEADLAEQFLGGISAVKFYTNQLKSRQVFKTLHEKFNKKYLFTIEAFKLNPNSSAQTSKHNDFSVTRKLDTLYKIVGMDELVASNKSTDEESMLVTELV